jgi:DNA-directed RNA polymerase specialized sigma24 family protein
MATQDLFGKDLTKEEAGTLEALRAAGREVGIAPIEIESEEQLTEMGITDGQCRMWYVMNKKIRVHLTPAEPEVADMLLKDLRKKYRQDSRKKRCKVPGKAKPIIRCPECNSCANCPYPEYRDVYQPDNLSWDGLIENGYQEPQGTDEIRKAEMKIMLEKVKTVISAVNPKFTEAIELKEFYGYTVREIAEIMGETERNVYHYISKAKEIGKQYKEKHGITLD